MLHLPFCCLKHQRIRRCAAARDQRGVITLPARTVVVTRSLLHFYYSRQHPLDVVALGLLLQAGRRVAEVPLASAFRVLDFPQDLVSWWFYAQTYWFRFFLGGLGQESCTRLPFRSRFYGQSIFIGSTVRNRKRRFYGCALPMGVICDRSLMSAGTRSKYATSTLAGQAGRRGLAVYSARARLLRGRFVRTFFISQKCRLLNYFSVQRFARHNSRWFRVGRSRGRKRRSRLIYLSRIRKKWRGFTKVFPAGVARRYRFVRKFRALFTVRAQHTNLFFTIRQGAEYFLASTGMFEDLKHGTKRKRTLLAGWFLADRLFERAQEGLKEKTIFQVDLYGRTSGRRGVWFSWRTKPWRLFLVRSRTPIAYNGTRGCRRRRL